MDQDTPTATKKPRRAAFTCHSIFSVPHIGWIWPASHSSEPEARMPSSAQTLWRASFAPIRLTSAQSEGWWEALVTLQFVTSDFVLRHPIYSRAAGSLPLKMVAGVGVAPTYRSL